MSPSPHKIPPTIDVTREYVNSRLTLNAISENDHSYLISALILKTSTYYRFRRDERLLQILDLGATPE